MNKFNKFESVINKCSKKNIKESNGARIKNFKFIKDFREDALYVLQHLDEYPEDEVLSIKDDIKKIKTYCVWILKFMDELGL